MSSNSDPYPALCSGFHDDPIRDRAHDSLRRTPFANRVANLIRSNHRPDSSVVYGLEGPWGSGKSSVISLIRQSLEESGTWSIAEYTPWATSGSEALFEEFFAALAEAAPSLTKNEGARRSFLRYAELARSVGKAIPGAGGLIEGASDFANQTLRKSWKALFTDISGKLQNLESPILVIVDDIDRLQATELLDLLKVIRLLGRFPGIDFLLAYDEDTVVDTLSHGRWGSEGVDRARAFMEKIVQYPMSLPPLLRTQIVKLLETGIAEILGPDRTERSLTAGRIVSPLTKTMPAELRTPRAIQRFLAQVEQQFESHVEGEVNDVDLILTTLLRVQFPDLFAELEDWKRELTRQEPQPISFSAQEQQTDWEPLLSKASSARRRNAKELLETIFPVIAGRKLGRRDIGRFAHPDYFDRYLAQAIPDGDIPDSVVTSALGSAAEGDASTLRSLLVTQDSDIAALALAKIRDRYPDVAYYGDTYKEMGSLCTPELLASGMSILDDLPDRIESWTNELSQCTYWLAFLLRILLTENPTQDLTEQIDKCQSIERRAHVLSSATISMENLSGPAQTAITQLIVRETERIIESLLADLTEGEKAPGSLAYSFLFGLVTEFGDLPQLQEGIQEGLRSGAFTVEDIAARLVSFSYMMGSTRRTPWAASFSAELFTKITGIAAEAPDLSEKGDWEDKSWSRRKEFARQYIHTD